MPNSHYLHSACLALLGSFFLVSGCDNSIEPFSERGTYSVYGFLDPTEKKQLIRVKPLSVPITKVDSGSVNATVTLENLDTGTSEVLKDSIIAFEDAEATVLTHSFWTETPIPYETRYRLTIEGEAGSVESTTTTPTGADPDFTPEEGRCRDTYSVVFTGITDQRRVRASWEMHLEDMPAQFRRGKWAFFDLNLFETEEGYQHASFNPRSTLLGLFRELDFLPSPPPVPDSLSEACWSSNPCAILGSNQVRVRYTYLGPEWYGDIPVDSITYDPLSSHDVTGGIGFFGSARRDLDSVKVDRSPFVWTGGSMCTQSPPDSISDNSRAQRLP